MDGAWRGTITLSKAWILIGGWFLAELSVSSFTVFCYLMVIVVLFMDGFFTVFVMSWDFLA